MKKKLIIALLGFALVACISKVCIIRVHGDSMLPTLENREYIIGIRTNNIEQNDIIVFEKDDVVYIKRVIACGECEVKICEENKEIYVNGNLEGSIICDDISNRKLIYIVPEDMYFVLGENYESSIDSRNTELGFVEKSDIICKVLFK